MRRSILTSVLHPPAAWRAVVVRRLSSLAAVVPLTQDRYSGVHRGLYAALEPLDLDYFGTFLAPHQMIKEESELLSYNTDWLRMVRGSSQLVLKPKTTQDVSRIMQHCFKRNLAVCPQGGNTGLVGGSVPVFDEIIISLQLMNRVMNFNDYSGALVCQAGCILQRLDEVVAEHGFMMPIDLGAAGSCHIGGNVSTNAGGIRLLRYGNLHGNVLGVEAVLSNGDIFDGLTMMRKDDSGYDLSHMFVGSEGTLGIVTQVAIQTVPRPKARNVAFLGVETFEDCLKICREAKSHLAEVLSSCEFMDAESMRCVQKNLHLPPPISDQNFYLLLETSGSNGIHDMEKLSKFLERILTEGLATDGTLAEDLSKQAGLWKYRERMAESLLLDGYTYKYDISLPIDSFYRAVEAMRDHLKNSDIVRCCGYGHLGDGNLHLNVTASTFSPALLSAIEPFVYEWTSAVKGSVSAEHGVGFKKKNFIHFSKSPSAINLMRRLKGLMDPTGILNPYKVLPSS